MAPPTTQRARRAENDRQLTRSDRGTTLVLVPTMLLVLIALGGIAIDMSLVHAAHRAVHRTTSAAADDAAGMLDTSLLQRTGELRIDPEAARRVVAAEFAEARLPGDLVGTPSVVVDPSGSSVSVTVDVDVERVMLRAIPGQPDSERLRVTAMARLER